MSDQLPSLRLQLAGIPEPVLALWRSRYAAEGAVEVNAQVLVDSAVEALRSEGKEADAHAVWVRLSARCEQAARPSAEMIAATALVGLATGLRPQGFNRRKAPVAWRRRNALDAP